MITREELEKLIYADASGFSCGDINCDLTVEHLVGAQSMMEAVLVLSEALDKIANCEAGNPVDASDEAQATARDILKLNITKEK